MKRTLAAVAALPLLALAQATPVDAAGQVSLNVGPGYWCDDAEYSSLCATDLVTDMWNVEHGNSHATLRNLGTGRAIPVTTTWEGQLVASTIDGSLLPGGTYSLVVTVEQWGHWSCSQYNPSGCSWIDAWTERGEWRFKYVAGSRLAVARRYVAPSTSVTAKWKRAGNERIRLVGAVKGRVERSDFTLTPRGGLAGRMVRFQELKKGTWRTRVKMRTRSNGTYLSRPIRNITTARWGRITVSASKGSPSVTLKFRLG